MSTAKQKRRGHKSVREHRPPVVRWLQAGTVAAGMGASLAWGAGVAGATTGDDNEPTTAAGSDSVSGSSPSSAADTSSRVGSIRPPDSFSRHTGPVVTISRHIAGEVKSALESTSRIREAGTSRISAQGLIKSPSTQGKPKADRGAPLDGGSPDNRIVEDTPAQGSETSRPNRVFQKRRLDAPAAEHRSAAGTPAIDARSLTLRSDSASGVPQQSRPAAVATAPEPALASASVTDLPAAAPAYPEKLRAPVTLRSMVTDVFRWFGVRPLDVSTPVPAVPVPRIVELLWVGLRRVEYTVANHYPTASPAQIEQVPAGGTITTTGPLEVTVKGSLNADDPDGDRLTYTVVSKPSNGSVVVNPDGTYTYNADPDFARRGGEDSFTVRIDDTAGNPWHIHGLAELFGRRGPTTVTVPVTVTAVNRAPTATSEIVDLDTDADGKASGNVGGADPDADRLTYTITGQPARGKASVDSTGNWTYQANPEARHALYTTPGAPTTDTFTVTTSDGLGGTTTTTVTVTLTKYNQNPGGSTAVDGPTGSNGTVVIAPSYTDPDGDDVKVTVTIHPEDAAKGFLRANPDGSYTFLPTQAAANNSFLAGVNGQPDHPDRKATFTVTATDPYGGTHTEDVDVEIVGTYVGNITMNGPILGGVTLPSTGTQPATVWDPATQAWVPAAQPPPLVFGSGAQLVTVRTEPLAKLMTVTGPNGTLTVEMKPGTEYTVRETSDGRPALWAGSSLMTFLDLSLVSEDE